MTRQRDPVRLPANQPKRFYRGGAAIADLRGAHDTAEWGPEDWVASTTTLWGERDAGLSRLPDGRFLRDAVAEAPVDWLGADHVAEFGADPALLVKLLDAGQRLPVHVHPDNDFARRHLNCRHGKTEAWVVIGTTGPDPLVYLGFRADTDPDTIAAWVSTQDTGALLGALNPIPVRPGDTVLVPAGQPHAIGAGVFIVELQQPTDFSVMLEWQGFGAADDPAAHLGLGYPTALSCLSDAALRGPALDALIRHTAAESGPLVDLFGPDADLFFRADRLHTNGYPVDLDPGFTVLVGLDGSGALHGDAADPFPIRRGDTVVVPHAAGRLRLTGSATVIRCRPPRPTPTTTT